MPARQELPDTLKRSPRQAQETWSKAHDGAVESYGEGRRAHQTAYAALKRTFHKVEDHWELKERKGPSDPRAAGKRGEGKSFGGVDYYGSTKAELYERAKKLDVRGRSSMNKEELAEAISKKQ
jgi:cation transport regulator ChaB